MGAAKGLRGLAVHVRCGIADIPAEMLHVKNGNVSGSRLVYKLNA
jgi:hypothetical protein